jgi:predicted glutamine amidotransferase
MCGLAGFARSSDAPGFEEAKIILEDLLLASKNRGTHATGVAAVQQKGRVSLLKKAVVVDKFVASEAWKQFVAEMPADTTRVLGHVRWSTHPQNTYLDEAAHPFIEGRITGAHNGIIRNWKELAKKHEVGAEWINDSQAPFGLMNKIKNPADVLKELEGYWALTWTKGESLFVTRSGAPLAMAYIPDMKTLFWVSEMRTLKLILDGYKLEYKAWEISEATIYRFDVTRFDDKGTHPDKKTVDLKPKQGKMTNSARPDWNESVVKGATTPVSGYSTTRSWSGRDELDAWQREPLKKKPKRERKKAPASAGQMTLAALNETLAELRGEVQGIRAENEYLWQVVRDAGLLDIAGVEDESYAELSLRLERERDMEEQIEASAGRELERIHAQQLLLGQGPAPILSNRTCEECHEGDLPGDALLPTGDGHYIHQSCIFAVRQSDVASE